MNFSSIKYKANYYALLILCFVIPLERKLISPLIIIFFITSIINFDIKSTRKSILIFTSLFFLYLIGIFFSENYNDGFKDLTQKLSLLVFPLSFYFSKIDFKAKLNNILNSFIEGCLVGCIILIVRACILFYFNHETNQFFYEKFALFSHPSYASMLLNFAIITIYIKNINQNSASWDKKELFLIFYFTINIILFASKAGIISLLTIHLVYIFYKIIKEKKYLKNISILGLSLIILSITFYKIPSIKNRLTEMTQTISSDETSLTTSAARIEIWKIAYNLIKEKPIVGYGTSNEKTILINEYQKLGFLELAKKQLNAHNQFLQTSLALGLIGLIGLLFTILYPLFLSLKNKHYLYTFLLILISFNLLFESMFERQVGLVFFMFFSMLLFSAYFGVNQKPES